MEKVIKVWRWFERNFMPDWYWVLGDSPEKTILRMCEHPVWGSLEPVLVSRRKSGVPRHCGKGDVLAVSIHTATMRLRAEVFFVVPRKSSEFRLEWYGDRSDPTFYLKDEKSGELYREGALS